MRQLVDRVVGPRLGRVAALVVRGELILRVGLLGGLQREAQRLAVLAEAPAAAIGIQPIFGVGPLAPLGRGKLGALAGGLLVAGEQHHDVAARLEPLRLQLQQSGDNRDITGLHVQHAATIIITVLLKKLERVDRPVGGLGLHHVHMAHQQDRLLRGSTRRRRPAHDQRGGVVGWGGLVWDDVDVRVGETRLAKLIGEIFRQLGRPSAPFYRRDVDRMLQHLARLGVPGVGRRCGERRAGSQEKREGERPHGMISESVALQLGSHAPAVNRTNGDQDAGGAASSST